MDDDDRLKQITKSLKAEYDDVITEPMHSKKETNQF